MNTAANSSTVALAAEYIGGELIFTDSVLANLTALSLTNISLFDFASTSNVAQQQSQDGQCKVLPGDAL